MVKQRFEKDPSGESDESVVAMEFSKLYREFLGDQPQYLLQDKTEEELDEERQQDWMDEIEEQEFEREEERQYHKDWAREQKAKKAEEEKKRLEKARVRNLVEKNMAPMIDELNELETCSSTTTEERQKNIRKWFRRKSLICAPDSHCRPGGIQDQAAASEIFQWLQEQRTRLDLN